MEKTPRRRTVHVPKNVSKQFSDQPSASARQPAGGGAEPSGARRCSVRSVPDLRNRPAAERSWVVSSGQVITPAGKQVNLGNQVRAKAIALNPNVRSHTAAVLTLGASEAVEVFDTRTGAVLQDYITFGLDSSGSY